MPLKSKTSLAKTPASRKGGFVPPEGWYFLPPVELHLKALEHVQKEVEAGNTDACIWVLERRMGKAKPESRTMPLDPMALPTFDTSKPVTPAAIRTRLTEIVNMVIQGKATVDQAKPLVELLQNLLNVSSEERADHLLHQNATDIWSPGFDDEDV